jgi:hypothetical protein
MAVTPNIKQKPGIKYIISTYIIGFMKLRKICTKIRDMHPRTRVLNDSSLASLVIKVRATDKTIRIPKSPKNPPGDNFNILKGKPQRASSPKPNIIGNSVNTKTTAAIASKTGSNRNFKYLIHTPRLFFMTKQTTIIGARKRDKYTRAAT